MICYGHFNRANRKLFALSALVVFMSLLIGCQKDVSIPGSSSDGNISFVVPQGWPQPAYKFDNNPLTNEGFALGRKLFYDPRLSIDNTISCGSCHQAFSAFAHLDHDISHGVNNLLGTRNSPPLFNLNWHTSFMWDGGINHIEIQPIAPIQNPVEMHESLEGVLSKLRADNMYKSMFTQVFGNDSITTQRMLKAMAQFMGALVSANSKYDQYMRNENGVTLSESELSGMSVFQEKCASCHPAPLFTDHSFRNAGLAPSAVNDSGRAKITLDPADMYKFKVPSLRNLSYTSPYMHDGRFTSLSQVLEQMSSGIHESATLDPLMKDGIQLTDKQKSDLLNFLNTLNDESFITDKRFQEPK